MKFARFLSIVLLAYIVMVSAGIEILNGAWNHWLPTSEPQTEVRGYMEDFKAILFLYGTGIYPACLIAFFLFIGLGKRVNQNQKSKKCVLFSCAALCLAVLARFYWLGVFSVTWGSP